MVDDEPAMRKKYRKLLRQEGFKVIVANDAVDAANVLMREKANIDLILLDINMAEIDGRDTFDIIDEYSPGMQVIVTSVYPVSEQKFKIPRAVDYYDKSQNGEVLIKKIKKVLGL